MSLGGERGLIGEEELDVLLAGNPGDCDFFLNWGEEDGGQPNLGDLWHNGGPGGEVCSLGGAALAESAPRLARTLKKAFADLKNLRTLLAAHEHGKPALTRS